MEIEIVIAIMVTNFITALFVRGWCNKRISEITDINNWKDK